MRTAFIVGCGGFWGTCLRYGINSLFARAASFPFATLVVNCIAALAVGFIVGITRQIAVHETLRLFLTVGLLGGLSTFSTFSMETIALFEQNQPVRACGNIAVNLGLCLVLVVVGLQLARLLKG